jgi:alanine racemase
MTRPLREACVDLDAVAHNIRVLRGSIGDARLMTVVKSRAYGHGAVAVARAAVAAGTDWLGVVDIPEALELRAAGIDAPILAWLHGPEAGFDDAIAADIDLGVHYLQQLDRVADAAGTASVQLKVDTGLGRNGAVESDWRALFEAAAEHERAGRVRISPRSRPSSGRSPMRCRQGLLPNCAISPRPPERSGCPPRDSAWCGWESAPTAFRPSTT